MAWNTGTWLARANSIFFCQFCVHICLHLCRHQIPLCHGIYSNWVMSLITMMILHRLPKTSKWTDYSSSTLPYRSATISWLPPSNWNIRFLWWLPPILWSHAYLQLLHLFPRNPFCFTICISCLGPHKTICFAQLCTMPPNLSASKICNFNELRWLIGFGFASITFGPAIQYAVFGTRSHRLACSFSCLQCRVQTANKYFRFVSIAKQFLVFFLIFPLQGQGC